MIRATARAVTALGAFLTLSAFVACDGRETPVDPAQEAADLTITPASGGPGSIVVLASPALDESAGAGSELSVDIGGLLAPARFSPTGELRVAVPMLAAGEAGDAPPDGPVTVELFEGEELLARAELAFTVTALEPSPGALDSLGAALTDLAQSVSKAADGLGAEVSVTSAYAQSIMAGLEALLVGEDERSLASHLERLESEDPEAKALLEGALAATGVIEATRRFADALEAASAAVDAPGGALDPSGTSSLIVNQITDVDLAAKMQFYTMARLFGETVVNETASEYAATVGLASGVASIAVGVPAAAGIGALLSVADFAVNKVYLGLFPAELSSFEIVLEDDQLRPGEITAARLELEARNDPPTLSLQEFINLAVELNGLNSPRVRAELVDSPFDVLENFYNFLIGVIHGQLSAFQTEHPELGLDPTISQIPNMTWTAVGHDVRLFEVRTFHPDIVTPAEGELDWVASGPDLGEARVNVQTNTGPESILIDEIPGVEYTGGAFGEDVIGTETISIFVTSDLVLEVDFTSTIEDDDIAALEARAGHLNAEGEPVWEPGIEISLIVDGGTVADTSGVTDSDGQFITLAQLTPESESIIITVTAADALGQEVDRTVEASASGSGGVIDVQSQRSVAQVRVNLCCNFPAGSTTSDDDQVDTDEDLVDVALSAEAAAADTSHSASASSSLQHFTQLDYDAETDRLLSVRMTTSGTLAGEQSNSSQAVARAGGHLTLEFFVREADVSYSMTGSFQHGNLTQVLLIDGGGERVIDFDYQGPDAVPPTLDTSGVLEKDRKYSLVVNTTGHLDVEFPGGADESEFSLDLTMSFDASDP